MDQHEFEEMLETWLHGATIVDEYNAIRGKKRPESKDIKALLKMAHNTPSIETFARILVVWWASGDDRLLLCMFDNDNRRIDANMRNVLNDWERHMPDAVNLFADEGFIKEECILSMDAFVDKAKNKAKTEKLIAANLRSYQSLNGLATGLRPSTRPHASSPI
jgi:hypothetical protein